jgi:uncharacterized protein
LTAYFDTSAVVKLVVAESGSNDAVRIWEAARSVASSVFVYPEARGRTELRATVGQLARVGVTTALATRSGVLAREHDLRGYDAVHLASAELLHSTDLVFVGADRDLCAAARRLGFAVAGLPA